MFLYKLWYGSHKSLIKTLLFFFSPLSSLNFYLLYQTCHTIVLNKTSLNKTSHEKNRLCNELSTQPNLTEVKNREHTKAGTSPVNDPSISSVPGKAGIKRVFRGEKVNVQIQCSLLKPLPCLRHEALMKMYRLNLMDLWTESLPHLE